MADFCCTFSMILDFFWEEGNGKEIYGKKIKILKIGCGEENQVLGTDLQPFSKSLHRRSVDDFAASSCHVVIPSFLGLVPIPLPWIDR